MKILDPIISRKSGIHYYRITRCYIADLIQQEKLFIQDDVTTRLSKIANNLGAIKREVTTNPDTAASLIKESLYYVEWTAPTLVEVDVEQAAEER